MTSQPFPLTLKDVSTDRDTHMPSISTRDLARQAARDIADREPMIDRIAREDLQALAERRAAHQTAQEQRHDTEPQ